jgi:hypothetical protein
MFAGAARAPFNKRCRPARTAQTGPSSSDPVLRRSVCEATVRSLRIMEGHVNDGSAGKVSFRFGCPEFCPNLNRN